MNKPDFSAVTKKNGLSDKERASRRQASGNYNEDGTIKKPKKKETMSKNNSPLKFMLGPGMNG